MNRYVLFGLLVLVACSSTQLSIAQARGLWSGNKVADKTPPETRPQFDITRYLSRADREDISRRIALREVLRHKRDGTLSYSDGETIHISIPARFERDTPEPGDSYDVGTSATVVTGLIDCDINVQIPHAGRKVPGGPLFPKAKSRGTCTVTPTGQGALPPFVNYELSQVLIEMLFGPLGSPLGGVWTATHPQTGLNVSWQADVPGQRGTQVFGECPSAPRSFAHSNMMWIYPAPGWRWLGDNPFPVGTPKQAVVDC